MHTASFRRFPPAIAALALGLPWLSPRVEHTTTVALPANSERGPVTVTVECGVLRTSMRGRFRRYVATATIPGRPLRRGTGQTHFHALLDLRRKLERDGVRLRCWGARADVWPTGIQSGIGEGLVAASHENGQSKSIYAPLADGERQAAVDEQTRAFEGRILTPRA